MPEAQPAVTGHRLSAVPLLLGRGLICRQQKEVLAREATTSGRWLPLLGTLGCHRHHKSISEASVFRLLCRIQKLRHVPVMGWLP